MKSEGSLWAKFGLADHYGCYKRYVESVFSTYNLGGTAIDKHSSFSGLSAFFVFYNKIELNLPAEFNLKEKLKG